MSQEKLIKILSLPLILTGLIVLTISAVNILKPQSYAGEIFGKKITQSEFNDVHKYNRLQSVIRYGKMFESIEPLMDLDAEAWDQLLLLKEAKNRQIKVGNQDVIDEIAKYPYFFRNGKFDSLLYRDIIRYSLKAEVKEFEESVRQSLLIERLRESVTGDINPAKEELLKEFQKRRDLVQVQYATVEDKPFLEGLTSTDEEAKAYYAAHPDMFETGESVKIQYIQMPFPPDGGVQKQVETKFKGRAIIDRHTKDKLPLQEAAAGMKFELKETGFFTREDAPTDIGVEWSSEMTKNIFRMKKNELSQPLEQKTGYIIIKMSDKKEPHTPAFEDIKDKVTAALNAEKARGMAFKKAEEHIAQISAAMQTGADFKTAASGLGLEVKDNNLTQRESVISALNIDKTSVDAFAAAASGTAVAASRSNGGALILFVTKIISASTDAFEKNAKSFRELTANEKKDELFKNFLKDLQKKSGMKKY